MPTILVIDDDSLVRETLEDLGADLGHEVLAAASLAEGLDAAGRTSPDVVMLDVQLPDGNGLEAISELKRGPSQPEVIIFTGHGNADGAELAISCGAWDYIEKPALLSQIELPIIRAMEFREKKLGKRRSRHLQREGMVGESPVFLDCLDLVAVAAESDVSVLVSGETGTGKEMLAHTIHSNSSRAGSSFVVVDCAALPASLVESLLFGHVKGAFTGATISQRGMLGQADGGTLFLDEVGELPLAVQKTFLRVLQGRCFRPLGGGAECSSDFRLIAATNRDLSRMAEEGLFRQDLLFRLRSMVIDLPPLRERMDDLGRLIAYHQKNFRQRTGCGEKEISPELFEMLSQYDWPGNIRELINTLDTASSAAWDDAAIVPQHLPTYLRAELAKRRVKTAHPAVAPKNEFYYEDLSDLPDLKAYRQSAIEQAEADYLSQLLSLAQGDMNAATKAAGLSLGHLYALMRRHNLPTPGRSKR